MQQNKITMHDQIRSVLIPVGQFANQKYKYILLPNLAVAKIMPYQEPSTNTNQENKTLVKIVPYQHPQLQNKEIPDWFLGQLNWRGLIVPVIDWERLVEQKTFNYQNLRTRIAIIYTLNGNHAIPYIGIFSPGAGQLVNLHTNILFEDTSNPIDSPMVKATTKVAVFNPDTKKNELLSAWIPNLDELEHQVTAIMIHP